MPVPTLRVGSVVVAGVGAEGKVGLDAFNFGPPGLSAWTIDMHFDPDVVELLPLPPLVASDRARVGGAAALGRVGQFVIASVRFRCLTDGETELTLQVVVLSDGTLGDPQPIDAELIHGQVFCGVMPTVTPTSSVAPTPTATPPTGGTPTPGSTSTPGGPPTATRTPSSGLLYGDADCDLAVSSVDAALILQFGAGLLDALACQDIADVNGDLRIDSRDAALVRSLSPGSFQRCLRNRSRLSTRVARALDSPAADAAWSYFRLILR